MKKACLITLFFVLVVIAGMFIRDFKIQSAEGFTVKDAEAECPKTNGYIWCAEKNKCILFADEDCAIRSFEECERAGFPVMESNPRKCSIPGGESFVEGVE